MEFNFDYFANLAPMKYYDKDADDLSPTLQIKRQNIINNLNNEYIATEKHDGEWAMFIFQDSDKLLIRSRSKGVNGSYGDFTAKLPHIVETMKKVFPGHTVLLGEICYPAAKSTSRDVGTILRCLPTKAIERQKDHPLYVNLFDVLFWNGKDFTKTPYEDRIDFLLNIFGGASNQFALEGVFQKVNFFEGPVVYTSSFAEHADEIIAHGGEGLVIQRKDNPYLAGTRTAWKSLKLKQKLPVMELQVVDIVMPNRNYDGQDASIWKYWEGVYEDTGEKVLIDHVPGNIDQEAKLVWSPVTKPYYFHRAVGVKVKYNDTVVSVTSGCSEDLGDYLISDDAAQKIKQGLLFAQVKAMMESQNGALRHPVLVDIRTMDTDMQK